jgi:putative membrane protein
MTAPLLVLLIPNAAIDNAFLSYGFARVAIAGFCGTNTVMSRIIHMQTVPAALGSVAM